MALILECDMTQSIASDSTPRKQGITTSVRLNLMRQNNFQIFKERRCRSSLHSKMASATRSHTCTARDACVDSRFQSTDRDQVGGASRDRTGDLLLAKQALSQLSYGP
jgi:hypothetical protein